MKTLLHVEICGGIGVGKSTLSKRLASLFPRSSLVSEDFQSNTLWHRYYKEPSKYVREKNISFLAQHFAELKSAPDSLVIADFSPIQDLAYAALVNDANHQAVMTSIYLHLQKQTSAKRLVIHLTSTLEKQRLQIQGRGREEEQSLTNAALSKLNLEIKNILKSQATKLEVMKIDASLVDLRDDVDSLAEISNRINAYYTPR